MDEASRCLTAPGGGGVPSGVTLGRSRGELESAGVFSEDEPQPDARKASNTSDVTMFFTVRIFAHGADAAGKRRPHKEKAGVSAGLPHASGSVY